MITNTHVSSRKGELWKGNSGSTYMVWLLFSTMLMSPGCSSGIHLSSSSTQGYFMDEGTTTRRGHSCLKAYAAAMACTVFPRPIWTDQIDTPAWRQKNKSIGHRLNGKLHMTAELMQGSGVIRSQNDSCVKTD